MSGSPSIASLTRPAVLIALSLFVGAFLLRLLGIGWGLPNDLHNQSYHPDELLNFGVSQQIDLARGKLTPGFYNYGTAYFTAENVAARVASAYGAAEENPWKAIGKQILAGRLVNALAGAGCVVVLWLILRRITTAFGALFGAGVLALAPGFVVHSRFETPDVFATFWLCLSGLFALRIVGAMPGSAAEVDGRTPTDLRDAVLAGVFAGISTGTKYTGVLVLVVLWLCLALTRRKGWLLGAVLGTASCLGAGILTTPGAILDSARFVRDFGFELGHSASGHGLVFVGTSPGYVYHVGNLIAGVGLLLTSAGVFGLFYAMFKRHAWAIALLAFALIYYFVIGRAEVKFLRYTFPLLLPIACGFGYLVGSGRRLGGWGHAVAALGIVALAGFDMGGLVGAVRYSQFMTATDPRDEAAMYLKRVANNGTVGLVSDPWFYTPPLIPDAGAIRSHIPDIYAELAASEHPRVERFVPNEGLDQRMDWDTRLLSEMKPDYVVYSSFESDDLDRLSGVSGLDADAAARVDHYQAFMQELSRAYVPAAAFGANPEMPPIHDLRYIRPIVWVWKRK